MAGLWVFDPNLAIPELVSSNSHGFLPVMGSGKYGFRQVRLYHDVDKDSYINTTCIASNGDYCISNENESSIRSTINQSARTTLRVF